MKGEAVHMSYEFFIINTIASIIGAALIIYFFYTIFGFNISIKRRLIFTTVFSIITGFISTLLAFSPLKPIILLTVDLLIITFILGVTLLQSFIAFSIYIIGLAIGDALVAMISSFIINDLPTKTFQTSFILPLIGNILANAFAYLLFIMIKPFKNFIMVVNRNKFLYLLTAFTVLVISASFALHRYMNLYNFIAYSIISIITILYCIFIILVWFNTLRKAINEEELEHQKFYNESLRSTLFDLRRFKHDWNNNLTVIYSMLKMDKINELKQYVAELIAHNAEHCSSTEIFSIKNAGLFGIISSKMNQASEKGVKVELSVLGEVENIPGVKISELCEIVGIFLDNAIEEAIKAAKQVGVLVRNSENGTEISISNGCLDTPDIKSLYREGYSTKGENRGMGLAIARKIIDKYDNILLSTSCDDNVFTQTLEIVAEKGL
jgi:two-component system sensor histidine kinase AgrC